jgi:hypothetical protein
MFASRTTKEVTITDKDGTFIVLICRLSADSLDRAREVRQVQAMKQAAVMTAMIQSTPEVEKMIQDAQDRREAKAKDPAAVKAARYAQYDRTSVLRAGIRSWSDTTMPVETGVADLDGPAADVLHRAILDLSIDEPAEVEEAQGKETAHSTVS